MKYTKKDDELNAIKQKIKALDAIFEEVTLMKEDDLPLVSSEVKLTDNNVKLDDSEGAIAVEAIPSYYSYFRGNNYLDDYDDYSYHPYTKHVEKVYNPVDGDIVG